MSTNTSTCFDNIIGLSQTECECFDSGKPVDFNTSQSGIYLDELEGINLKTLEALDDCAQGGLWDLMDKARDYGIKSLNTDLMNCIRMNALDKRKPFASMIGDYIKSKNLITLDDPWHGIRMIMADHVGGKIILNQIGGYFNMTTTLNVYLYKYGTDDPLASWTIATEAGKVKWNVLPEPMELDMAAGMYQNATYYLIYEPVAGLKAYDTKMDCGCGGWQPRWSPYSGHSPYFESSVDKNGKNWANWMAVGGTEGATPDDLASFTWSNLTQGLLIQAQSSCDISTTICNGTFDFTTDNIGQVIAHAIRYKAGSWLMNAVLSSGEPNRYTVLDGDRQAFLQKDYEWNYQKRVTEYLCKVMSSPEYINKYGDCLQCKHSRGFVREPLLV